MREEAGLGTTAKPNYQPSLLLPIQPDNILVLPSKKGPLLKLLDYGAARHLNPCPPLQSDYEPAHSYQYSAPEMFQQLPLETGTDIW